MRVGDQRLEIVPTGEIDSVEELRDLPGLEELKGAGLLSGRIPANFNIPLPMGHDELTEEEDPITQLDLEELGLLTPGGEAEE